MLRPHLQQKLALMPPRPMPMAKSKRKSQDRRGRESPRKTPRDLTLPKLRTANTESRARKMTRNSKQQREMQTRQTRKMERHQRRREPRRQKKTELNRLTEIGKLNTGSREKRAKKPLISKRKGRAMTRKREINQKNRRIWYTETQWISRKRRSSSPSGKSITTVNGREDQERPSSLLRLSSQLLQRRPLLLLMRPTTERRSKISMMLSLVSTRVLMTRRLSSRASCPRSRLLVELVSRQLLPRKKRENPLKPPLRVNHSRSFSTAWVSSRSKRRPSMLSRTRLAQPMLNCNRRRSYFPNLLINAFKKPRIFQKPSKSARRNSKPQVVVLRKKAL